MILKFNAKCCLLNVVILPGFKCTFDFPVSSLINVPYIYMIYAALSCSLQTKVLQCIITLAAAFYLFPFY